MEEELRGERREREEGSKDRVGGLGREKRRMKMI